MFHGAAGEGVDSLADFIAATILETRVDHPRLPLLSERQARTSAQIHSGSRKTS
jgi:hypothetical protein